jgi:BCD family chlorophyll transporter-like MFS transporter
MALAPRYLPFADAATADLPMGRLLRLSLFQITVGMALVLMNGTLNRVMIVELGVPAALVATMIALPLVFAPARALIGFRSDNHRSFLGWRRVPYIWAGTLLQFGGFAIMPFALLVLSGDNGAPVEAGKIGAALAFLLVGAGMHTVQTAGLALATDLAPPEARPRVVAFMYVMMLVGMVGAALVFGGLLRDYHPITLIQVIQGAALATMVVNVVALWKQEPRDPALTAHARPRPDFRAAWARLRARGATTRVFVTVALGTAAFSMQDILLEPYGGEVLGLGVGATTALTALLAGGTLVGLALAARNLARGGDPYRLAACGVLVGVAAFSAVVFAGALQSVGLFAAGVLAIGFGGGMFAVGTMVAAMQLADGESGGLTLGAWGAVQATAAGIAIAVGGLLRDGVRDLGEISFLGDMLSGPAIAYSAVYHVEIALLFMTLIAIGPLVRRVTPQDENQTSRKFGLADLPS